MLFECICFYFTEATFITLCYFYVPCAFRLLVVMVWLSIPVQVIDRHDLQCVDVLMETLNPTQSLTQSVPRPTSPTLSARKMSSSFNP